MFQPKNKNLITQLDNAPKKPGVYLWRNETGKVIYVGKAVNLYNRSRSYFLNYRRLDPRIQNMINDADSIEYIVLDNEVEALLFETNLIKKYKPKFNILMIDDKGYIWIKVNSQLDFPTIQIVRTKKKDKADYFGPFPAKSPIRRVLKDIRGVFKYCSNPLQLDDKIPKTPKPCFYYHLDKCPGACIGKISKKDYRENINNIKRFLRSQHADLKADLRKQMDQAAKNKHYEYAAVIRDQLRDLDYVTKFSRINEKVDEEALEQRLKQDRVTGLTEIIERLELDIPLVDSSINSVRFECYDISNIQGTNATASMVVAIGGKKKPNLYRKFKIKTKDTPDDFAMLQEVMARRLKYLAQENVSNESKDESFLQFPDLIIIDGGKGQLSSVLEIVRNYPDERISNLAVVGLAKREEEVVVPVEDDDKLQFKIVKFSKRSAALRIFQLVRDEAHRFGLGYHRLLRSKGMVYSKLDLIPGVGEVTKKRLLQAFGSVEGIQKASLEDLSSVVRNRTTARNIKKLISRS